ncbi:hypothetical protein DN462_26285, partial [Citrobacter freundii]
ATVTVLKGYQELTPSLSTGTGKDIFQMVTFDYQLEAANFNGNSRLRGQFDMEFLVSPHVNTKTPSTKYDELITYFEANYAPIFKAQGVTVLWVNYGNSSLVTDKTTGISSLIFTLNIEALERK